MYLGVFTMLSGQVLLREIHLIAQPPLGQGGESASPTEVQSPCCYGARPSVSSMRVPHGSVRNTAFTFVPGTC